MNKSKPAVSCIHFNLCSGCQIDLKEPFPSLWQEALNFFRDKGLTDAPFFTGPASGWRVRAKLAVRGTPQDPLIGLFREGSHVVLPIPFCQVHHPHINRAVEIVKQWIQSYRLAPYQELTGQGDIRYIQCVVERSTGLIQLSLVLNFEELQHARVQELIALLQKLGKQDNGLIWHSIWINLNHRSTNTIFGPIWHLCYGQETLWEKIGTLKVAYQPSSFGQANLDLFEDMLMRLRKRIPQGSKLVEFYAGVGVMGLFLVDRCQWVRCAEINPHAEKGFLQSLETLPKQEALKISFHTGPAQDLLNLAKDADTVLVDPPRKGLDQALMDTLIASRHLKKIYYLSCGWLSFKNDCEQLIQGGWKLAWAEGYYFFPGSNHIEILAEFSK